MFDAVAIRPSRRLRRGSSQMGDSQ
uniref:Uncharacterized protein n=1 Tax=Arundo donax TaxID=35708 RepID=A0A0A8Z7B1_ARUDO